MTKQNDKALFQLLDLIRKNGPISQTNLSEVSGYSKSTVSINCDKLLKEGYIIPTDEISKKAKRNNSHLLINNNIGYIVGIGMGATHCRISIFNLAIEELETVVIPSNLKIGPEPVLQTICETIEVLTKKLSSKKILGIGLGIPAPIRYEEGEAYFPVNMYGWHLYPIKKFFKKKYICPVFIDNEANTMALYEYSQLNNKSIKSLMGLKIGTGIGAGLINSGEIYRGENGGVGNLGHIKVCGNNKPCTCGKLGCLETVCSVPAIINKAIEIAKDNPSSILNKYYNNSNTLTLDDINNSIENNDNKALELVRTTGTTLGAVIGQFITFVDPGVVIVSGSICTLGPIFIDFVNREVAKQIFPLKGTNFVIKYSKNHGKSSAIGAAQLCIEELFIRQLIIKVS